MSLYGNSLYGNLNKYIYICISQVDIFLSKLLKKLNSNKERVKSMTISKTLRSVGKPYFQLTCSL